MRMRIWVLAVCCLGGFTQCSLVNGQEQVRVLTDHVGYEAQSEKQGLVVGTPQDHPQKFSLIDTVTGLPVLSGNLTDAGQVHAWEGRKFWVADFSSWKKPGHYAIKTSTDKG